MFKSDINDKDIQVAVKITNWLLTDSLFYDEIRKLTKFSHTRVNGEYVAEILYANRHSKMEVVGYKTLYPYRWPFPKVKGYYSHENPDKIFVNLRSVHTMDRFDHVGNFIHEKMHSLGYEHKGNSRNKFNNIESVPYKIGYLAKSFAMEKWNDVEL